MAGLEVEPGSLKQDVCLEGASEPSGRARVALGAGGGRPQVLCVGAGKTACRPPPDSNMAKGQPFAGVKGELAFIVPEVLTQETL